MRTQTPSNNGGSSDYKDPMYGAADVQSVLPSRNFPTDEMRPEDVFQLLQDELYLDGNARQNLATFCQTWEDDYVHRLMDISISKNWIDKDEYPQTAAISLRCVNMIGDLWHVPQPANGQVTGTGTVGSSEACMLGGMAAKWRWRAKRLAQGKPVDKPNLVCGPVQVCWHKFCRYWDVEKREIPMEPGKLMLDPQRMLEAVDENTIVVVPTFGVTYTGHYEYPEALHEALDKLQKTKGLDIDIHVDAASGGFLAPFCAPEIKWDFQLPRVKSISSSGHKYGLAPLGSGWVIWREKSDLPEDLIFSVDYLGGSVGTFAINFSRPAGQVIAQYYDFLRLGKDGYKKIHMSSYHTAQWIAKQIAPLGPYEFLCDGSEKTGIPAVCFQIKPGEKPGYNLYDISDRLRERGWQVPAFALSGKCSDVVVMRIMCRQGFTTDMASLMIDDFKAALAHFQKHPITKNITAAEGTSFHH